MAYISVTELKNRIASRIVSIGYCWVVGETTNFKEPNGNGNYYFSIKDNKSCISCFMTSGVAESDLNFEFKNGVEIALYGNVTFWSSGVCVFYVSKIREKGVGEAQRRYEEMKARLEADGIFDTAHHKTVPMYAQKIGIVTSGTGQGYGDIKAIRMRKNPYSDVFLCPVNVEGPNAASSIVKGIKKLDNMGLDLIIVGRGGGPEEGLKCFEDEQVLRTVYEAVTPIVAAVGHAANELLINRVADSTAITPTDAADKYIYDVNQQLAFISRQATDITDKMKRYIEIQKVKLQKEVSLLGRNDPEEKLNTQMNRVYALKSKIIDRMNSLFIERDNSFKVITARLNGLSPLDKLCKGYGYISESGIPVYSVNTVNAGDDVTITIHDGQIMAKVTSVKRADI